MSKAAHSLRNTSRKVQPDDVELLEKVKRCDMLWQEEGRLCVLTDRVIAAKNGKTVRVADERRRHEVTIECKHLAFETIVTPAHTPRGLAAQRRVLLLQRFEDHCGFFDWLLDCIDNRLAALRRAKAARPAERAAG